MPAESYAEAARSLDINTLIIGTSKAQTSLRGLDRYIDKVIDETRDNQHIWIGGDAVFNLQKFKMIDRFHYISTLDHLDNYLSQI